MYMADSQLSRKASGRQCSRSKHDGASQWAAMRVVVGVIWLQNKHRHSTAQPHSAALSPTRCKHAKQRLSGRHIASSKTCMVHGHMHPHDPRVASTCCHVHRAACPCRQPAQCALAAAQQLLLCLHGRGRGRGRGPELYCDSATQETCPWPEGAAAHPSTRPQA